MNEEALKASFERVVPKIEDDRAKRMVEELIRGDIERAVAATEKFKNVYRAANRGSGTQTVVINLERRDDLAEAGYVAVELTPINAFSNLHRLGENKVHIDDAAGVYADYIYIPDAEGAEPHWITEELLAPASAEGSGAIELWPETLKQISTSGTTGGWEDFANNVQESSAAIGRRAKESMDLIIPAAGSAELNPSIAPKVYASFTHIVNEVWFYDYDAEEATRRGLILDLPFNGSGAFPGQPLDAKQQWCNIYADWIHYTTDREWTEALVDAALNSEAAIEWGDVTTFGHENDVRHVVMKTVEKLASDLEIDTTRHFTYRKEQEQAGDQGDLPLFHALWTIKEALASSGWSVQGRTLVIKPENYHRMILNREERTISFDDTAAELQKAIDSGSAS